MKVKDVERYMKENFNPMAWLAIVSLRQSNGYKTIVDKFIRKANNCIEFLNMFLMSEQLSVTSGYAYISKVCENVTDGSHWLRIRAMLGDRVFKTTSNVGGVKIGNEKFSVVIRNGRGDGVTRVAVVDYDEFNTNMMTFETSCEGEFNIYAEDIGRGVAKRINGEFFIYVHDGIVVFVKMN